MNASLKVKFLQFLSLRKKEGGFTLIELLVVIIIVGILSAVALPSFLNQRSKAKQTEAETNVGAVNTQQNAFFTEEDDYAQTFQALAVGSLIKDAATEATANYKYEIGSASVGNGPYDLDANIKAENAGASTSDISLKSYSGGTNVYIVANQPVLSDVVCISSEPSQTAAIPVNAGTDVPYKCDGTTMIQLEN